MKQPATFTIRLEPELREKLQKLADKDKRKLGNLVQKILEDFVARAK
jgi:predicted transcriptional regulator